MTLEDLVRHIQSGSTELVLDQRILFSRRRRRSELVDFGYFLQELQSNQTILSVECAPSTELGIPDHQWTSLVTAIGDIGPLQCLTLCCATAGALVAVATAVQAATLVSKLTVRVSGLRSMSSDVNGLLALANTLKHHSGLQTFVWYDSCGRGSHCLDCVLVELVNCRQLRQVDITAGCASAGAMANLLELAIDEVRLVLNMDQYPTVTDRISGGRCSVRSLKLHIIHVHNGNDDATLERIRADSLLSADLPVVALATAIGLDVNPNLHDLELRFDTEKSITGAAGEELAGALTNNQTLNTFSLFNATLEVVSYQAFRTMLRANNGIILSLTPLAGDVQPNCLLEYESRLAIEQRLNRAGRVLSGNHATREEWVGILSELTTLDVNDLSTEFQVSCLYQCLQDLRDHLLL
jgi:hypothetical protein